MSVHDQHPAQPQLAPIGSRIESASSVEIADALVPADGALVLADGARVSLRPLCSDDRPGLAALFARLSPESRRTRFLGPKRELTPRELSGLTDIDHVHHEAIAAIDERDGSIVGVGRYARIGERAGVAEAAIEVADDLQRMGIGTELARRTARHARANGFTLLTATTLRENRPARALLRRLGFRACASHDGAIDHELELDPPDHHTIGHAPETRQRRARETST